MRFVNGQRVVEPPLAGAPGVERARLTVRAVTPHWDDDLVLEPCLSAMSALVRAGGLTDSAGAAGGDEKW